MFTGFHVDVFLSYGLASAEGILTATYCYVNSVLQKSHTTCMEGSSQRTHMLNFTSIFSEYALDFPKIPLI
jgi:hypothetical protein